MMEGDNYDEEEAPPAVPSQETPPVAAGRSTPPIAVDHSTPPIAVDRSTPPAAEGQSPPEDSTPAPATNEEDSDNDMFTSPAAGGSPVIESIAENHTDSNGLSNGTEPAAVVEDVVMEKEKPTPAPREPSAPASEDPLPSYPVLQTQELASPGPASSVGATPPVADAKPAVKSGRGSALIPNLRYDIPTSKYAIKIVVGEPQKRGDGMNSYIVFRVDTQTDFPMFGGTNLSVYRRFSDFLGLHTKLFNKFAQQGRIVPPAPEKSSVGMVKVKMSKEEATPEFVKRRCSALQRFLMRVANHHILVQDNDFIDFLKMDGDLPRSTDTSALSSAGVGRLFKSAADAITKATVVIEEDDETLLFCSETLTDLENQLGKLFRAAATLTANRQETAQLFGQTSKAVNLLSAAEEVTSLASVLVRLGETLQQLEEEYSGIADNDYENLEDQIKDYMGMLIATRDVMLERMKRHREFKNAEERLRQKREQLARMEIAGRQDKVEPLKVEVEQAETGVNITKQSFDCMTETLKQELYSFDFLQVKSFKESLVSYLEKLLQYQENVVRHWETIKPIMAALEV